MSISSRGRAARADVRTIAFDEGQQNMGTAIVIGSLIGTAGVIAALLGGRDRDPQPALIPVERPRRPGADDLRR